MTKIIAKSKIKRLTKKPSGRLNGFVQSLGKEWRRLRLPENCTVVVAVSGGADSVALLLGLTELSTARRLKLRIVVAHLNHKLRAKRSEDDARWVRAMAKKCGHKFVLKTADVGELSRMQNDNVEQVARRVRYDFLKKTAAITKAGVVLTAHTMDDQAETVLLNLLRGAGGDGLGGIEPSRRFEPESKLMLARPLLSWARRSDTENYCRQHAIDYRVDEMNTDEAFARVRVRRQLIPLMTTFNPRLVQGLARTADLLREDRLALEGAAKRLLELSSDGQSAPKRKKLHSLRTEFLRIAQPALRRRALRLWLAGCRGDLTRLEQVHVAAVEKLLFNQKSGRIIELPGGDQIVRSGGRLHFRQVR